MTLFAHDSQIQAVGSAESVNERVVTLGLLNPISTIKSESPSIFEASTADEVLRLSARHNASVLILGPRVLPVEAHSILGRLRSESPELTPLTILLCATEPALFQKYIDENRIFYLTRGAITNSQIAAVLSQALAQSRRKRVIDRDLLETQGSHVDRILDFCMKASIQSDLTTMAKLIIETVRSVILADDAQCLIHNKEEDVLTSADTVPGIDAPESAAAGLVGFVVRTGEGILHDHAESDPRYDSGADNPKGFAHLRFLAEPIAGIGKSVLGLITATRSSDAPAFSLDDSRNLKLLADCASPTLSQLLLQAQVRNALNQRHDDTLSMSHIFREEALEHQVWGTHPQGDVLKTLPRWLGTTHYLVLTAVFLGLLATLLGKMNNYESGPAVVRISPGSKLASGDSKDGAVRELLVFLPEPYSSQLRPRTPIHVVFNKTALKESSLYIDAVDVTPLTAKEAAHEAGVIDVDLFSGQGPLVCIKAKLPDFTEYEDGAIGKADVIVGSEPIIFQLVPALKSIARNAK